MWDREEPLELDYPVYWSLHDTDKGVFLRHNHGGHEYHIGEHYLNGEKDIPLPKGEGEERQITVNFKPLKRIRPAFITNSEASRMVGPADRYVSSGIREHLISFREMLEKPYEGSIVESSVFDMSFKNNRIEVKSKVAGLRFKPSGSESKPLLPGVAASFTESECLTGAFIYGSYWWRLNKFPTPEMLALDELDTENKAQDLVSLQSLTRGIGATLMILLVVIRGFYYLHHDADTIKPPVVAEVELKKPKLIAKAPELPKPTPAQIVKATPTSKPKVEPPKPKKEIVKKEPLKKPVPKKEAPKIAKKEPVKAPPVKAPPPKIVKAPPPAMPVAPAPAKPNPVVAKAPDPSVIANQQKAALAKSLNFLSTGPSKTVTALATNPFAKSSAKYANAGAGSMPATTSELSKMAKENGGDGPIATRGARNVASNSGIAGGHGKGLNEVQGKVSLNALYGGGSGEALGAAAGGGGISVTGPGKISDADIEKTLAKYLDKFQRCYEKALLTDSTLSGEVQIKWTINPNGSVSGASVVRSEMNQKVLHDCMTGVLTKITFPAPKGGPATVKKPFRFKSSSF